MSKVQLSDFIKAYDVRGIVPDQLDGRVCRALGEAFARVICEPEGHKTMVVGHDMRPSSPELSRAFAEGAAAWGIDVTLIGLCSSDQLYFAAGSMDRPGAMFTASHNPAQYNGIKMCRAGARPVGQDSGLAEVRDLAQWTLDRGEVHGGTPDGAGAITEADVLGEYGDFLHGLVDITTGKDLRIVVDAGNGMAGLTVPGVLGREGIGIEVEPLYFELDGTFPNHEANPLDPANLVDLQQAVVQHGADLGLAFDGDADRCFVVDERGEPVSPSAITALVATREIAREVAEGASAGDVRIIHNTITSKAVPEIVAEHGAVPVRTRVGHSFIKDVMAKEGAVFGGEHSAHYYFRDFWFADTGMLAAMHVIAALKGHGGPLSDLVAEFSRYHASGEINSKLDGPQATAEATQRVRNWATERGAVADELDGLTMSYDGEGPSWWFSLRPSNTEPLLRLNVEAADQATCDEVRDAVLTLVRQ